MHLFSWRKRATKHFGEMWRASIDLHLLARDRKWLRIQCDLDTGAVVTLLPASVLRLIGLDAKAGQPIELTSVGGFSTRVRLVHLPVRVGEFELPGFPLAFAEHDGVPHLLGWKGFLDRLGVSLHPLTQQSCIWPGDSLQLEMLRKAANPGGSGPH